jgi:hypothetical protein
VLLLATFIAACGDDGDGGNGATGTTSTVIATSTTTEDPAAAERQEVIDAYLAAEEAAAAASEAPAPDPEHPDLLATHTALNVATWSATAARRRASPRTTRPSASCSAA